MFSFVVRYLGFLKTVPLLPYFFDSLLKLRVLLSQPAMLDRQDELEVEVSRWPGVTTTIHKYGGLQFNFEGKEIGHLHSNGLLDVLYSVETKKWLFTQGRLMEHHVFPRSGWISFCLKSDEDVLYAKRLLLLKYLMMKDIQ